MNKLILITKPNFDETTFYISHYAQLVQNLLDTKGISYKSFDGEEVTKNNIHKFLSKRKPKFLFLNGHGTDSFIEGHKNEIIFTLEDKDFFTSEIIYARSCLLGKKFGKELFKHKEGCFIGYKFAFSFFTDTTHNNNPSKDKVAELFLKPSNEVAISIIKGNTTQESCKRSKQAMLKNMKKIMNEPNAMPLLGALWNNYEGQVIFGNKEQTF